MSLAIPLSNGALPLSRQIYQWIRTAALTGTLAPAERLPSTRDLAEQLGVSRTVVLMAYDQLLAEGFLTGRHGSGTFVSRIPGPGKRSAHPQEARIHLARFGKSSAVAATNLSLPSRRTTSVRYDFSYRNTPAEGFPLVQWQRILARRARKASPLGHDYGFASGNLALREAIAAHLRRSRAVVCDASQIVVVNGSQQALDLAARVLLERGDSVVIEDPHYQGAREVFRAVGARLLPVPVDNDGVNTDKLPDRARLAFVTPSHQFPTGTILTLARRLTLLAWAKRNDAVIIEDDYDGEFRYEGRPVESMQGLDTEGRVIYVGTFSRTIFPSLRIGYLIAPKSLVPAFMGAKWLCDRHTSTLEQETLAEFISSGAYERYLRRTRRANALRREALLAACAKFIGDRAAITGDGSGTHVVLWPRRRATGSALTAQAAEQGVGVYPIEFTFLRRAKPGLLLGYANMHEADIREGIRRLATVL